MRGPFVVQKARNGQGLFTQRSFKPDHVLFEIKGTRVHYTVPINVGGTVQENMFRLTKDYYLSPEGEWGALVNHSCVPNSKVVKVGTKLYMVAINEIPKGSEILFDYATIIAHDDIWTIPCNCGESICRGVIARFTKLPKHIQRDYIDRGIVAPYIVNMPQ